MSHCKLVSKGFLCNMMFGTVNYAVYVYCTFCYFEPQCLLKMLSTALSLFKWLCLYYKTRMFHFHKYFFKQAFVCDPGQWCGKLQWKLRGFWLFYTFHSVCVTFAFWNVTFTFLLALCNVILVIQHNECSGIWRGIFVLVSRVWLSVQPVS